MGYDGEGVRENESLGGLLWEHRRRVRALFERRQHAIDVEALFPDLPPLVDISSDPELESFATGSTFPVIESADEDERSIEGVSRDPVATTGLHKSDGGVLNAPSTDQNEIFGSDSENEEDSKPRRYVRLKVKKDRESATIDKSPGLKVCQSSEPSTMSDIRRALAPRDFGSSDSVCTNVSASVEGLPSARKMLETVWNECVEEKFLKHKADLRDRRDRLQVAGTDEFYAALPDLVDVWSDSDLPFDDNLDVVGSVEDPDDVQHFRTTPQVAAVKGGSGSKKGKKKKKASSPSGSTEESSVVSNGAMRGVPFAETSEAFQEDLLKFFSGLSEFEFEEVLIVDERELLNTIAWIVLEHGKNSLCDGLNAVSLRGESLIAPEMFAKAQLEACCCRHCRNKKRILMSNLEQLYALHCEDVQEHVFETMDEEDGRMFFRDVVIDEKECMVVYRNSHMDLLQVLGRLDRLAGRRRPKNSSAIFKDRESDDEGSDFEWGDVIDHYLGAVAGEEGLEGEKTSRSLAVFQDFAKKQVVNTVLALFKENRVQELQKALIEEEETKDQRAKARREKKRGRKARAKAHKQEQQKKEEERRKEQERRIMEEKKEQDRIKQLEREEKERKKREEEAEEKQRKIECEREEERRRKEREDAERQKSEKDRARRALQTGKEKEKGGAFPLGKEGKLANIEDDWMKDRTNNRGSSVTSTTSIPESTGSKPVPKHLLPPTSAQITQSQPQRVDGGGREHQLRKQPAPLPVPHPGVAPEYASPKALSKQSRGPAGAAAVPHTWGPVHRQPDTAMGPYASTLGVSVQDAISTTAPVAAASGYDPWSSPSLHRTLFGGGEPNPSSGPSPSNQSPIIGAIKSNPWGPPSAEDAWTSRSGNSIPPIPSPVFHVAPSTSAPLRASESPAPVSTTFRQCAADATSQSYSVGESGATYRPWISGPPGLPRQGHTSTTVRNTLASVQSPHTHGELNDPAVAEFLSNIDDRRTVPRGQSWNISAPPLPGSWYSPPL